MKTICIKSFIKKASGYEVTLGNGTHYHFTSLKATHSFLAATNKFLNESLFNVNLYLSTVYPITRQIYILNNKPEFDRRSQLYIDHIEEFIRKSVFDSGLKSGNYLAFIALQKACQTLKLLVKHLQSFDTIQKTDTHTRYTLGNLFDRVQSELMRVQNYGLTMCHSMVDIGRIEDMADLTYQLNLVGYVPEVA